MQKPFLDKILAQALTFSYFIEFSTNFNEKLKN